VRVGIMQPYFFPYIGYFQLIHAVDRFVIYDDVNYINRGWINRNSILGPQGPQRITLQLSGASQNKLIGEIRVGDNRSKLLKTVEQCYRRAPCFDQVFPVVRDCLECGEISLSLFLEHAIRRVCDYIGVATDILVSSQVEKDSSLKGQEKIIALCKSQDADIYVNAIGGRDLYDEKRFEEEGMELRFLQTGAVTYAQFSDTFYPNLSIIDVMMFNSKDNIFAAVSGNFELI